MTLGSERLTIDRDRTCTTIPLAVVQEVRQDGDTALRIVLTDGVAHRIEGANATATGAFLSALNDALPAERDPAGSASVTVESLPPEIRMWQVVLGIVVALLLCAGYVAWAGSHKADSWPVVAITLLLLLAGLLGAVLLVISARGRVILARRGLTVRAVREYFPTGRRRAPTSSPPPTVRSTGNGPAARPRASTSSTTRRTRTSRCRGGRSP
ncbi:hypothetical protein [Streptomyces sp. NBC_01320]|uniref:hypothetical protein n=1 Tax=Streptomyces sp. NBC_01320 TaxID=2903824 RepID=UPI002E0D1BF4|nr:hypothetical protein OG395_00015 [Streptomyces sp. NBC_01320]WSK01204.1 hypothetical protein OG395_55335 [Streptomyces sp. NBC_01320]